MSFMNENIIELTLINHEEIDETINKETYVMDSPKMIYKSRIQRKHQKTSFFEIITNLPEKNEENEFGIQKKLFKNEDTILNHKYNESIHKKMVYPCINCNRLLSLEDSDLHSKKCVYVRKEVMQIESSKYNYHLVEDRLKKINDHLINMISRMDDCKEKDLFEHVYQNIKEAIECNKIEEEYLKKIYKIIQTFDFLLSIMNIGISSRILLERSRLLVYQKYKIMNDDLSQNLYSDQLNEFILQDKTNNPKNKRILSPRKSPRKKKRKSQKLMVLNELPENELDDGFSLNLIDSNKKNIKPVNQCVAIDSSFERNNSRIDYTSNSSLDDSKISIYSILETNETNESKLIENFNKNQVHNSPKIPEKKNSLIENKSKIMRKDFDEVFKIVKYDRYNPEFEKLDVDKEIIWEELIKKGICKSDYQIFVEMKFTEKIKERRKKINLLKKTKIH